MIEFTKVDGRDCGDVKLFALSTCGWCKRARMYLEDNGVAYRYIYVDRLHGEAREEALELMRKYDASESYPTIAVGETDCVVGFNRNKLDRMIGV